MKNLLHSNKAYDDLIFASANVYLFQHKKQSFYFLTPV
jgi:hypothetical protein